MINILYFDDGIRYTGLGIFVTYHTFNSTVDLKNKTENFVGQNAKHKIWSPLLPDMLPPGFHEGINKLRLKSKGNIKMSHVFAEVELADLLHVDQQRLPVVLPLDGKLAGVRKLIAGQLHRHLETVGVQVAEIVHACEKKATEKDLGSAYCFDVLKL